MKKFFKALAVVLALTLVIGTIPASAAIDFALKRNSKIIYIDGAKGTNGEKKCVTVNKYQLTKLFKSGFDAEVMDLKLESADKNIATTSNKYDRVYAQNIGKTTVKLTVVSLDTDKILDTEEVKIQVKKNATEDTFKVVSEDIVDGAKLGVNTEYTLTMPRVDAEGNWLDTDKRALTCDSDSVVITATNKYATAYTVKFTEAGEFTLKASTFQSKKFPDTLLSKEIKVTVGYAAESVAQSALAKADVTFDSNVGKMDKASFGAYYMINDTQIPFSSVKDIAVKDNVVTVEFFTEFAGNTEYFVTYEGETVGSFKALDAQPGSVAVVVVPDQNITVGEMKQLEARLLSAEGVDVTDKFKSSVSFGPDTLSTNAFISGGQFAYITNAGETYEITATYTWYDSKGDAQKVTATGKITSVAKPVKEFAGVDGYLVDDATKGADKALTVWAKNKDAFVKVNVKYNLEGKALDPETFATVENGVQKYNAIVADPSIIMLGAYDATNGAYKLIANKEGTTSIIVGQWNATKNHYDPIYAFAVTAKADTKATKFTVTPDKNLINVGYPSDTIKFTVKLFDQYEQEMSGAFAVSQPNAAEVTSVAKVNFNGGATGEATLKVSDIEFVAKGGTTLKFTSGDFSTTILIQIDNVADAATYTLNVNGDALDTGFKADTAAKSITVSLDGKTANGFAASGASISFVAKAPTPMAATGTGVQYVYTVAVDGKLMEAENANFVGNTFTSIVGAASSQATKLAKGNYVVTAYKVEQTGTAQIVNPIGSKSFTVTDNQTDIEVKQTTETVTSLDAATIMSAFECKFNGNVVAADSVDFTVDGAGTTAFVKNIKVKVYNPTLGYVEFTKDLGVLIKK